MFTRMRFNNYIALESFAQTIGIQIDHRIRACNYILTYEPLYEIAEIILITNSIKELSTSYRGKISDEIQMMINIVYNFRIGHAFVEMSLDFAKLHLLNKEAFETIMNALHISKYGIPEKELVKYTDCYDIISKGNYYKLSDITIEDAIEIAKDIPGYLIGTLQNLKRWTHINNLQQILDELNGDGFANYRNIGPSRRDLLASFIMRVKNELIK